MIKHDQKGQTACDILGSISKFTCYEEWEGEVALKQRKCWGLYYYDVKINIIRGYKTKKEGNGVEEERRDVWLKIGNKDHPNEENVPLDKENGTIVLVLARFLDI